MNAASQLLRILAIVGAIAAGALYYLSTKPGTSGAGGNAAAQPAPTATAAADTQKTSQALSDAQADVAVADNARAQALAQLNSDEKKMKEFQSTSDDKDTQIADLTTKLGAIDGLNKQIADLTDQNGKLQQQIAAGPAAPVSPVASTGPAEANTTTATATAPVAPAPVPVPVQLTSAAPAKILLINTKQWLMVLNVGTADGLQKDSQLQLKVNDTDIGTAIVRDTDAKDDHLATVAITSTGGIAPDDYSKIVKKNLNVEFQRVE